MTSRAKQQRMGIDSPFVAWLTDDLGLPTGEPVRQAELVDTRNEQTLVYITGKTQPCPWVSCPVPTGLRRRGPL